jgi:hypothetical protein
LFLFLIFPMPHPYHPVMNTLTTSTSAPVILSLLGPNILLDTMFSDTLNLCSSLDLRDQVSHPYKASSKIVVLCILNLMSVCNRWEDKEFWTEWQKVFPEFSLLLIMKKTTLWGIVPCSLIQVGWCFRGSKHIWNAGLLLWDYIALYPRRLSYSFLLLSEP